MVQSASRVRPPPLNVRCWSPNSISAPSPKPAIPANLQGRRKHNSSVCSDPPPPLPAPPIHQGPGHDTRIAAPLMSRQSETQSELHKHSGNHTPNTCAQEYPEGPKSAELMRENIRAPQV
ncbi:Hypothetical predicted protein [Scomber scombrus]|uniref:Uncharacterized protein n=1 Tax=Scomber scombrus TaxID=13677 RepID=A0AAV1Q8E6_SCOSC